MEEINEHYRLSEMPTPSLTDWNELKEKTTIELKERGCFCWDEADSNGYVLMLFPGEWYSSIPDGYRLRSISGDDFEFIFGITNNHVEYGFLAYGVLAENKEK